MPIADSQNSSIDRWEEAYLRFETPAEEIKKFENRLLKMGVRNWRRDAEIVELCCGRGNGMVALNNLGFNNLEGIDLSPTQVARYRGPGRCLVGDCRKLNYSDRSKDIAIVQGGLHHLPNLPEDLDQTLAEVARVLRDDGRFVMVEPWLTPFLSFVHFVSNQRIARFFSNKIDAFATMTYYEQETYFRWLAQPQMIMAAIEKYFQPQYRFIGWGKLMLVGSKKRLPQ